MTFKTFHMFLYRTKIYLYIYIYVIPVKTTFSTTINFQRAAKRKNDPILNLKLVRHLLYEKQNTTLSRERLFTYKNILYSKIYI